MSTARLPYPLTSGAVTPQHASGHQWSRSWVESTHSAFESELVWMHERRTILSRIRKHMLRVSSNPLFRLLTGSEPVWTPFMDSSSKQNPRGSRFAVTLDLRCSLATLHKALCTQDLQQENLYKLNMIQQCQISVARS